MAVKRAQRRSTELEFSGRTLLDVPLSRNVIKRDNVRLKENFLVYSKYRTVKSQDKDKLTLFRGRFTITLDRARWGTAYKYLVVKKGKPYYEELPEFPAKYGYYSIVNRSLKIPDKHVKPGGK